MPPNPKSPEKVYFIVGKIVATTGRWFLILLTYVIIFQIGSMEGSLLERLSRIQLPRIKIQHPSILTTSSQKVALDQIELSYHTIRVGVFRDRGLADSLRSKLHAARIKSHVLSYRNHYYVCIGKYDSIKKAQTTLKKVKERGFPSASLILAKI